MMETRKKENAAAAVPAKEKKSVHDRFEFRWADRPVDPFVPARTCHRSHADPTADAAIGNIIREEKRKKRAEARRGISTGCRNENGNGNREKKENESKNESRSRGDEDAGSGC